MTSIDGVCLILRPIAALHSGSAAAHAARCMIAPVARNSQTFEVGNRTGSKLTPELSLLFINTLRMTGRISVAAGRCDIGLTTVRDWLRKGRAENADPAYRSFATDVAKARAEFLALAARRLAQLAVGGTMELPKYDKQNNIIRDANGDIAYEEKFFPPNPNALMHILDRIDPEPNGTPGPDLPAVPELTDAEAIAESAMYMDLFRGGIRVLLDLGVPIAAILGDERPAIETTAAKVPEPAVESAETTPLETQPARETDPRRGPVSESAPPEAAPAEPAPAKPPDVPDAF